MTAIEEFVNLSEISIKFTAARAALCNSLVERDDEIELLMLSVLCKEHVVFVSPPGLGKTMMATRFCDWLDAGHVFETTLSKFSEPDELFGPMCLPAYKEGRYERSIAGYMPTARIAYIDEVFNGSSAILNTLLNLMNERKFKQGNEFIKCPLDLMIGSSNQYPDATTQAELNAMFDRFLFRKTVHPVMRGMNDLLYSDLTCELPHTLSSDELVQAQEAVAGVKVTDETKEALGDVIYKCKKEGIFASDRRLRQCVSAIKAHAFLNGNLATSSNDLAVLVDCLWVHSEQAKTVGKIVTEIAAPVDLVVKSLLMEANEIVSSVRPSELAEASGAIKKLGNIKSKLKKLAGSKAKVALDGVSGLQKKLRASALEHDD